MMERVMVEVEGKMGFPLWERGAVIIWGKQVNGP
jgi:hypothetical protein